MGIGMGRGITPLFKEGGAYLGGGEARGGAVGGMTFGWAG